MKKLIKIIIACVLFFVLVVGSLVIWYFSSLGRVNSGKEKIEFIVDKNATFSTLGQKLEESKLIKSELAYKIYIKLSKPGNLKAGTYELDGSMGVKKIVEILSEGNSYNPNIVSVTFREGLNMRAIAEIIESNTENTYEDVFRLLKDEAYLNEVINNYWFVTEEVKNKNLYYSLEGYLFPDTYQIDKTWSIKGIFKLMLDRMEQELDVYKKDIEKSNYNVHELLTLASIIELEAGTSNERSGVAGVFYNRLRDGWTLGSDVTTYYAAKKSFKEDLTYAELNDCNYYNTRGTCFTGLPVGPISNPGSESIKGVMNPTSHNYYYFVADKNGKTYFNTNSYGHSATIAELKSNNLWYVYE
ncbi:MAG: endolytic transglycosylase MltG [Firmicutes bacterium]|nr:endolytic transglycosylase MltG [Bacillota bacterium]